jgi:hypothetical protein
MGAVPTLVLTRRYSPDSNALWRAAIEAGWDVERLQSMRASPELAAREPVFYGETLWADAVAETLGIELIQPTAEWLPRLPERYRRRQIRLATLAEAQALDRSAFVKAPDEKWMTARVYASGVEIEAPDIASSAAVLISEPGRFRIEFRTFVVERQVAALSPYVRDGDVARDDAGEWSAPPEQVAAGRAFVEALVADREVALPPAVVIDVGELDDGSWAVVEANACWASGICGCEPSAVLRVLRRATVRADGGAPADRAWLRVGGG